MIRSMRLKFWWGPKFGTLTPDCDSDTPNRDGVSVLCSLLTDSGGGHYLDAVPWLEEGLRHIESVKHGAEKEADWARDAWGARLSHDKATIYSLYQENYAAGMNLDAFETVLRAWLDFVQSPPDANASRTIEV